MSSRTQLTDERGGVRTEVYACSQDRIPWIDDLLAVIATYPFLNETYLSEFDTIDALQPIDQGTSPYTGVLLAPPNPFDPETLGITGKRGDDVLVHRVVGLLPKELEYAAQGGARDLWRKLVEEGEPAIDRVRSSRC
jgi:hypothetical protein